MRLLEERLTGPIKGIFVEVVLVVHVSPYYAAWKFFGWTVLMLLLSELCSPAYDAESQGHGTARASPVRYQVNLLTYLGQARRLPVWNM